MPLFTPTTPPHLRKRGFVEPLSHERLLEICYAYRRLKEHVEHLQADVNEIIEEFQHTQHGRLSAPLEEFIRKLSLLDAGISLALLQDIHKVDIETMKWEMKSSKLRSEAKRQRRLRSERRGNDTPQGTYIPATEDNTTMQQLSNTERLNGPDEAPGAYRDGMFADESNTGNSGDSFSPASDAPPTGMAALVAEDIRAVKLGLHEETPKVPANTEYKKSGLV